jgi:hypothetical protein
MSDIKNSLIKIAYENPELRADLLRIILAGVEHKKLLGEWYIKFNGQPFLVFKEPQWGEELASPVASVEKVSGSPGIPHKDDEYLIYSRSGKNRKVKMSDAVVAKMEHSLDNGETVVSGLIADFKALHSGSKPVKTATEQPAIKKIQNDYDLSEDAIKAALDAAYIWKDNDLSNLGIPDRLKDEPFREYRSKERRLIDALYEDGLSSFDSEEKADEIIGEILKKIGVRPSPSPKEDDYW